MFSWVKSVCMFVERTSTFLLVRETGRQCHGGQDVRIHLVLVRAQLDPPLLDQDPTTTVPVLDPTRGWLMEVYLICHLQICCYLLQIKHSLCESKGVDEWVTVVIKPRLEISSFAVAKCLGYSCVILLVYFYLSNFFPVSPSLVIFFFKLNFSLLSVPTIPLFPLHYSLCHPWSFVLASFRFIPLALTLSISFLPSPFSLPVRSLLPASSGNHAHQATFQAPLSTFQTFLSFIPPLLSLLFILPFPPWAHIASLRSGQTHVFRRYPHLCGVDLGKKHELKVEGFKSQRNVKYFKVDGDQFYLKNKFAQV